MSQCVPNWDIHETPAAARFSRRPHSSSAPQDASTLDYEVAELTWENGQLAMHAFGPPRQPIKTQQMAADATWPEKPRGNGTLESIVNQATVAYPSQKQPPQLNDLGQWFDQGVVSASATLTIDALVPCGQTKPDQGASVATRRLVNDSNVPGLGGGARMPGCSTRVASCSVQDEEAAVERNKRVREARVAAEWSGRTAHSVSVSATAGMDRDSLQMTVDTCDKEAGLQLTSTCMGSSDNTSSGLLCTKATTADDHDSVCHSLSLKDAGDHEGGKKKRSGKSSVSTKRSRAAAIHNQSERKRRDKINQRMKTLQKLVPNSSKTDKASVLDEVIDYLKQLQAQVNMVNRMNMQPSAAAAAMMFPMAALQQQQQQLQMSMMAPMMMGMGMPGVMDMNALAAARQNIPGMPNLHGGATATSPFLPPMAATWDASSGDRNLHAAAAAASSAALMMDPMAAFLASQSQQPMTLDTYGRMAAMYQQMAHQQQQPPPPASNSKNLS